MKKLTQLNSGAVRDSANSIRLSDISRTDLQSVTGGTGDCIMVVNLGDIFEVHFGYPVAS